MTGPEPPKVPHRIAQWLLPPAFRDTVLGDWAEEFAERCTEGHPMRARFVYWCRLFSPDLLRLRRAAANLPYSRRGPAMSQAHTHPSRFPNGLVQDARVAFRSLSRDRAFTGTALLVLGLGLGVATTVSSIINDVLLQPLEYDEPRQLVAVWGERAAEQIERAPLTVWDVVNLRENATTLSDVAAFFQTGSALQSDGPPTEVGFGWMTDNTLSLLGVEPMLGRGFREDDAGELLVVLDHGIWRTRFGADSTIVGGTIRLAQQQWTVIGVLPPGKPLQLPSRGFLPQHTDIWTLVSIPTDNPDATFGWMRVVGRLRPDATVHQAQQELLVLADAAMERFPDRRDAGFNLQIVGLLDDFTTRAALPLRLLASGAIVLLAIVFINVANLMLLRASLRRQSVAIRTALGAGWWRIAQPAVIEGAIISVSGAALGLAIAAAAVDWIRTAPPSGLPRVDTLGIDGMAIGFTAVAAILATVVLGLLPGALISRRRLESVLRQRTGGGRPIRRAGAFVVAEVALSVALLVGAGLLVRTTARMAAVDPGFETNNTLTFRVSLPNVDMTNDDIAGLVRNLEDRIAVLPGVRSVGMVHALPLTGSLATGPYARSLGELGEADAGTQINYRFATPNYLRTIRARLVEGRHLEDQDPNTNVVIDAALARTLWPRQTALGRQFAANPMQREPHMFTVVGVVEPLRHESIREPGSATAYFSARHYTPLYLWTTVHTAGDPHRLVAPIQAVLPRVHGDLAIARVKTMDEWVETSSSDTRWATWAMTVFAVAAALLSAIGVYGVLSHLVTGRTREIGIRLALGAQRGRVVRLVMKSGLVLVGVGLATGMAVAIWLSQWLESLLFGVSRLDPLSYLAGTVALGIVTFVAAWVPAARATRVNPIATLRND